MADPGRLAPWISGLDEVAEAVAEFTPEFAAPYTGISAADIRRMARELAGEPIAAIVYTDIAKDGMMAGPNVRAMEDMATAVTTPVIASGGAGAREHFLAVFDEAHVETHVRAVEYMLIGPPNEAPAGGAGSRAAPYTTLTEAVGAATSGTVIAMAPVPVPISSSFSFSS